VKVLSWSQRYEKGIPQTGSQLKIGAGLLKTGTKVTFKPDREIFKDETISNLIFIPLPTVS
jgi:DNA gyrase/topoisomerase IV subunit B